MTTHEEKHELREHLAVISTSAYFLLQAEDEEARHIRYEILQSQINAIIAMIDKQQISSQESCSDALFQ